jgi:tetratricopeptide (TPR) repeat protein
MLERDFGASINVDVGPEQWAKVEKAQFQEARSLFNQNQYERAISAYLKVLNLFPESETGVAALGELSRSYVELKDDLMFDVTSHYLAERFGRHRNFFIKAGDITLQLAAYMKQLGAPDKYDILMDLYFKKCPRHPSVPVMIMKRGDEKFTKEDYEGAAQDYQLVEENYSDSVVYENALNKRAICLFELDKKVEGIKALTKYIKLLEDKEVPDTELLSAKFRLAQMYRKLDKKYIPTAFKYYQEVITLMENKENRFHDSLNKVEANIKIYEACLFYQGMCYVLLDKPEKNIKAYRLQAIKFFDAMVKKYPKSEFAPQCLLQIGTLYAVLEDAKQAGIYLKQLQKDYPDSEEAANSDYLYADALMKMGRMKQAVEVFDKMLASEGKYSDKQIYVAAAALLEQKRYEISLKAFQKLRNTKETSMTQRVLLGLGESYYGTGQQQKAIEVLEEMLQKFDKTGHTPTAATFLSKAYGDIAMEEGDAQKRKLLFNSAVKHEKTVRKYQKTEEAKKESDLRVGLILKKKALAEEKFGNEEAAKEYKGKAAASLQTIIMFTDAKLPGMANVLQEAYRESVPLLAELEMWREVMEAADQYMRDFPAPAGKYTSEMRSLRNKAKVRAATMGESLEDEEEYAEDVEAIPDVDDEPDGGEAQPDAAPEEAPAEKPAETPAAAAPVEKPAAAPAQPAPAN